MQHEQAPTDLSQVLAAVTSAFGPVTVLPPPPAEDRSEDRAIVAA